MISLNGKKFAENDKEFMSSLFHKGSTCVGYAKRNKSSVTLMDHQKNKIGVINRHGVLCCATKGSGGYWHTHATIKQIGRYASYKQQVEECRALVNR